MESYPSPVPTTYTTVEDAARLLELGPATVRYHCRVGNLRAAKVGGIYLINKRSLERFILERELRESPQ